MGMLERVAAIGRGGLERTLQRAEASMGLRVAAAAVQQTIPDYDAAVPFFDETQDWRALGEALVKGYPSSAVPPGVEALDVGPAARNPKALAYDPFQMVELLGYKDRPQGLAFQILDQMVKRSPIIQAIIRTRAVQVARHCRIQQDSHSIGFHVVHRDKKTNLSRAARRRAEEIELALMRTTTGEPGVGRHNFPEFAYQIMCDSLTFDQACWEVIPSRRGKPHNWVAVDAKTIRFADTGERFLDASSNSKIRTVQVLDGQPIFNWPANEMAVFIRNRSTSIQSQGYGYSELEMLVHVVTAMLWAYQYNQRFFSQGSTQKGVLNFKGQIPGRQLAAFRRFFYQMISGVENAWKTPILNAEQGVEWVSMHSNNKDMEYSMWMDFLIKIACAQYMMDPSEVNMQYANDQERPMFMSEPESKVTASKDKGLKPILASFSDEVNKTIVHQIDADFSMEFMGLEILGPTEQAELDKLRTETYLFIDDVRKEEGLEPLPNGEGQLLNSGPWLQYKQAMETAKLMAAMPQPQQVAAAKPVGSPKPTGGPSKPKPGKPEMKKSLVSYEL